jgi:hypothetical protein
MTQIASTFPRTTLPLLAQTRIVSIRLTLLVLVAEWFAICELLDSAARSALSGADISLT